MSRPTVTYYSAGSLFSIAKQAYERTKDGSPDREGGKMDAIIAIVFSAMTLEAFINEMAVLITQSPPPLLRELFPSLASPPSILSLGSTLKEVEESKGTIQLKYQLAKFILRGVPIDQGGDPYQSFSQLIKIRDALVHMKAEHVMHDINPPGWVGPQRYPKFVESLRSRNILHQGEGPIISWIQLISTPAVARWACNVASAMVLSVLNDIPDGEFKNTALFMYKSGFQPIPSESNASSEER